MPRKLAQYSKKNTDLAERERRAVDLFNAKEVQRIDNSYCVDNAIDRTHFVEVHLLVKRATIKHEQRSFKETSPPRVPLRHKNAHGLQHRTTWACSIKGLHLVKGRAVSLRLRLTKLSEHLNTSLFYHFRKT